VQIDNLKEVGVVVGNNGGSYWLISTAEEVGRFHSQLVHQLENQLEQQKKIVNAERGVSERGTL
jgi:hypothetical protein